MAFITQDELKDILTSRIVKQIVFTFLGLVGFLILFDKVLMPMYVRPSRIVTVPDVTKKSFAEAKQTLIAAGLDAKEGFTRFDSKSTKGTVLSQNPPPDQKVKSGRTVYLTINSGERPPATVPDLKGRTLQDAKFALERIGLQIGDVHYTYSRNAVENQVTAQEIPKGASVKAGTPVGLTVVKATDESSIRTLSVPDVTGRTLAEASRMLTDAGFAVGGILPKYSASLVPNTVLDQSPSAGDMAPQGKPVNLIVASSNKFDDRRNKSPAEKKGED